MVYTVIVRIALTIAAITLVLGAACSYMSLRTMALWPALRGHSPWVWGAFAALALTMFLIPVLNRYAGQGMAPVAWVGFFLFGAVSTYIVYLALADSANFLVSLALRRILETPPWLGVWAVWAAMAATVVSVTFGLAQALMPPKARRVEVPILGLAPTLEGFTIVQISDLHISSNTTVGSLEKLTKQVNGLNPDVIAITGDLVDGPVKDLLTKVAVLGGLEPKSCVCYVTGNHEYYSGDLENWLDVFRQMNWCVLMNDNVFIQRNEATLAVVGIPDSTSMGIAGSGPKTDVASAMSGIPKGTPKILLYHRPHVLQETSREDIALQLSGHSHGGQFFPWSVIIPFVHDFPHGLRRYKRMWVYTSVGTGHWGPPNRFLRQKELTLLVLERTPHAAQH